MEMKEKCRLCLQQHLGKKKRKGQSLGFSLPLEKRNIV